MFRAIAIATAVIAAAPAFAGGVAPAAAPAPVVITAAPPPSTDWTGAYVGLQYDFIANGESIAPAVPGSFDLDGHLFGIFGGYRYDLGNFVVGGEIDYMIGEGTLTQSPTSVDFDFDHVIRVGAEAGFDAGNALIYGTVGFAHLEVTAGTATDSSNGYFFGAGVDYRLTDNIIVGAEVLQHDFSDFEVNPGTEFDLLTLGLNVAFTF